MANNYINYENKFDENQFLSEVTSSLIDEAVRHFNSTRKRKRDDDERYFYTKDEVTSVMSRLTNPSNVSCTEELDDSGNLFCYILNFKEFETESRMSKYKRREMLA